MPLASINGTELYYETRGNGPSLLFIQGASGDGGTFDRVADRLADEFTVVTYDRRGNSRSPRPPHWQTTSMGEQADDAAALLRSQDLAPAAIFGTSGGAIILLNLLSRHPDVVRGAIVHEPPLVGLLPNAAELGAMLQTRTQEALARGGPRGAMEMFLRTEAGDENFERLDPELRNRMLGNAELFFSLELHAFVSFMPDLQALRQVTVPTCVVAGMDHPGYYAYEAARRVADGLELELHEIPDKHAPYLEDPRALANALRPLLRQVSERTAHAERVSPC
jgi:pimeloyl-ACP methyl ester carboxylesterase